ncbi:MAG: hypothetical protein US57_C0006G0027 [Candidatus Moranbacteria bacterium GW2011_GWC2_37_73]|nr:MAG: hypothetical protein UR95_C0007G0030 [Parcubacteria group bacterium GW2011_GWC1_36_108]KKQ39955.1 MAG: hypothetical protein US57_C0006G0027 [Candidatus Moranbacteria bacterium GW2011_GWC2_37_73]HBU10366.1 hypothetical protein [Candidatus Moranbacteria bacterium]
MENLNWAPIEKKVNEAEKKKRQQLGASRVLYGETKMPKQERNEKTDSEILESSQRKRVAQKAIERETAFNDEAEGILGADESSERTLVNFRKENLAKALRYEKALEIQRQQLLNEESQILKSFNGAPHGEELEALDEIREELRKNNELGEKSLELNPEAYFGLNLKKLKEYKNELSEGRIVETQYVKEKMEDICLHLAANKPILIYGHLGSGKSELAMHTSKKYSSKDPLIISGSKNISQSEFYGHQVLTVDEESGSTVSDFYMGPIYQAMEDGRPVIIDEVNAIPHEVLISLNHILTRKVGDKINIQQDSGREVEIKEGFGIIMTGNLNQGQEKYVDRQDMDPAFLSRIHKIEYDYLPQDTEGSLESEAGKENEQFHLVLASIMDGHGNIEAPEDSVKKLWNLAKAARVVQNVFAGKEIESAYYLKEAGGRATKYLLKESVLSLRGIENIVSQWKAEGYDKELDYYVWNNFIKEGTVASDRAYLYQLMKDQFNFFKSDGWEQSPNYGSGGVVNSFDISAPKNVSAKRKFFGPREVVEFAFGKAPERAQWPEASIEGAEQENIINPEIMEMEEFKDELQKEMEEIWNEIGEVCEMEK